MWEFASRKVPYEEATPIALETVVQLGEREELIEGCPDGYMKLVQQCWHQDPTERPELFQIYQEIVQIRKQLLPSEPNIRASARAIVPSFLSSSPPDPALILAPIPHEFAGDEETSPLL